MAIHGGLAGFLPLLRCHVPQEEPGGPREVSAFSCQLRWFPGEWGSVPGLRGRERLQPLRALGVRMLVTPAELTCSPVAGSLGSTAGGPGLGRRDSRPVRTLLALVFTHMTLASGY